MAFSFRSSCISQIEASFKPEDFVGRRAWSKISLVFGGVEMDSRELAEACGFSLATVRRWHADELLTEAFVLQQMKRREKWQREKSAARALGVTFAAIRNRVYRQWPERLLYVQARKGSHHLNLIGE